MPTVEMFKETPSSAGRPLYGHALRKRLRYEFGSKITLGSVGAMVPNENCYCEIDPSVQDRWGFQSYAFTGNSVARKSSKRGTPSRQ